MAITFPFTATWDELAALPHAADQYGWDPSWVDPSDPPEEQQTLPNTIRDYCSDVHPGSLTQLTSPHNPYPDIGTYLYAIGFRVGEHGITVYTENALRLAHALFGQVMYEYDEGRDHLVSFTQPIYGGDHTFPPTWALFGLTGDDSVDYYGTQPSCLTSLLLLQL